ncbi:MAG: hypothetical protein EOO42_07910 [Flavobacteriales bacterium]|nr:MAG: hypothetical protein EOO42_07910 [Flavobacteriales bacterium]
MKRSKFISKFYEIIYFAFFLKAKLVTLYVGNGFFLSKKLWLIISLSLISLPAFTQGNATGCLLPNGRVYTSKGLLGTYFNSASTGLSTNYCSWAPVSGPTCHVCNGGLNVFGVCLSGTISGVEGTFTMVACPLDDYLPILTLIATSTGAYYIVRKKICGNA